MKGNYEGGYDIVLGGIFIQRSVLYSNQKIPNSLNLVAGRLLWNRP